MICASLISASRFCDSARMRGSESPDFTRSSNGSSAEKIAPALVELVRVAPEKPENATAPAMPGVSSRILAARWTTASVRSSEAPSGSWIAVMTYAWSVCGMKPVGTTPNIVPVSSSRPT